MDILYINTKLYKLKEEMQTESLFLNESESETVLCFFKSLKENTMEWEAVTQLSLMRHTPSPSFKYVNPFVPSPPLTPRIKDTARKGYCIHDKKPAFCILCDGRNLCLHGKRKQQCVSCGGSQICQHGRQKNQ